MRRKTILMSVLLVPLYLLGQVWDYPIKPGTEKWKTLKTNQEMFDTCQIPSEIIRILSTEELVQLCLNYPLLGDMLFSNTSYQDGFNEKSSNFNGFQELFKRKDAGAELLRYYETFDLDSFEINKGKTIKNPFFDICIDIVVAQPKFVETLDNNQKIRLLKEASKKLKIKQKNANSLFRQKTTAVIMSRLLLNNDWIEKYTATFKSSDFLLLNDQYILVDESYINVIQEETDNYLSKQ